MGSRAITASRATGNGLDASHMAGQISHAVASEFDRSMKKAVYIDDLPVPVLVLGHHHEIEYMNAAAGRMAGVAPGSAVGRKSWEFFDHEKCHRECCLVAQSIQQDREIVGDGEYLVQGRPVPVRARVLPRHDG